jgi:hypothetical protein
VYAAARVLCRSLIPSAHWDQAYWTAACTACAACCSRVVSAAPAALGSAAAAAVAVGTAGAGVAGCGVGLLELELVVLLGSGTKGLGGWLLLPMVQGARCAAMPRRWGRE